MTQKTEQNANGSNGNGTGGRDPPGELGRPAMTTKEDSNRSLGSARSTTSTGAKVRAEYNLLSAATGTSSRTLPSAMPTTWPTRRSL